METAVMAATKHTNLEFVAGAASTVNLFLPSCLRSIAGTTDDFSQFSQYPLKL
jgi:hypothetical protein